MLKRYADARHWGLFIPIGRRRFMRVWDGTMDGFRPSGMYRPHLCITLKIWRDPEMSFTEYRIRTTKQYL
jgi:hypothetical protein